MLHPNDIESVMKSFRGKLKSFQLSKGNGKDAVGRPIVIVEMRWNSNTYGATPEHSIGVCVLSDGSEDAYTIGGGQRLNTTAELRAYLEAQIPYRESEDHRISDADRTY